MQSPRSTFPHQAVTGTLPYMAPEQTGRINRAIDERSDLYALGITYYEMFGGRLPFEASSPAEWIHAHVAREPFPLHRCNPAVPPPLEAIINKLLSKVGDDRYQSAESLEGDLRRCMSTWAEGGAPPRFGLPRKTSSAFSASPIGSMAETSRHDASCRHSNACSKLKSRGSC